MLGELDEVSQLEELLGAAVKLISKFLIALQGIEDLGSGHLLGVYAESIGYIGAQRIGDAGIEGLLLVRSPVLVAPEGVKPQKL